MPRRGYQHPRQQRRVPVRVPGIGRCAAGDVARCVGENEVVDVGVFDWGVGVLPGAVYEEGEAESEREGDDFGWGEDGHGCCYMSFSLQF